jgi:hypothetical protein
MHKNDTQPLLQAFQAGDLLYGLEKEARRHYRKAIEQKLKSMETKHLYLTIDELNKPLEESLFYSSNYATSPLRTLSSPVRKHGQALLSSPNFRPALADSLPSPERCDRKIILACEFAILDCAGTIHFCLDGLKLDEVRNPDCGKEYNSFTAQELRFIADNFETVKGKVKFYLGGNPVLSPWEADEQSPASWLMDYRPSLAAKKERTAAAKLDPAHITQTLMFLCDSPPNQKGVDLTPDRPSRRLKKRDLEAPPQPETAVKGSPGGLISRRNRKMGRFENETFNCQEPESSVDGMENASAHFQEQEPSSLPRNH